MAAPLIPALFGGHRREAQDGRTFDATGWFERISARDALERTSEVPGSEEWIARYSRFGHELRTTVERILEKVPTAPSPA